MIDPATPERRDDAPGPPCVDVPAGYRVGAWAAGELIGTGAWSAVYAGRRADGAEVAPKFLPCGDLSPAQRQTVRELAAREFAWLGRTGGPATRTCSCSPPAST